MDESELNFVQLSTKGKGRKKLKNIDSWKAKKSQKARHSKKKTPSLPNCNHNSVSKRCATLTTRDINHFNTIFYQDPNKIKQDCFILKYTTSCLPKKMRTGKKSCSTKFFIKKSVLTPGCKTNRISVCRQTFLKVLDISKDRVQRICKRHLLTGALPKENRGGDRIKNKFIEKHDSVIQFIQTLTTVDSHYCREKNKTRQYVSSDLNIMKIWKLYNTSVEDEKLKVKQSYFRKIFNYNFNVGFGTPATDACSLCIKLKEQIKHANDAEKVKLITEKRIHNLRASAFYDILRNNDPTILTLSYDFQKNLPLPK